MLCIFRITKTDDKYSYNAEKIWQWIHDYFTYAFLDWVRQNLLHFKPLHHRSVIWTESSFKVGRLKSHSWLAQVYEGKRALQVVWDIVFFWDLKKNLMCLFFTAAKQLKKLQLLHGERYQMIYFPTLRSGRQGIFHCILLLNTYWIYGKNTSTERLSNEVGFSFLQKEKRGQWGPLKQEINFSPPFSFGLNFKTSC